MGLLGLLVLGLMCDVDHNGVFAPSGSMSGGPFAPEWWGESPKTLLRPGATRGGNRQRPRRHGAPRGHHRRLSQCR